MKNDLLYFYVNDVPLLVVPKCMQTQIVRQAHEKGHFGVSKTEAIVRQDYWFRGMRAKVEKIVNSCINCILAERKQGKKEGMLNVLDKGEVPLDTYHVDHVGPMALTSKKYKHIFVVIDAFSKFVWLYPTKSTGANEVLQKLQLQSTVFGNPRRLISDRGSAFTSNAFQDYCKEEKIEHSLITTGVPRGNGQVERVNRTIILLLTKLAAPTPGDWYKHVSVAQKFLNSTPSCSTGKDPFKLMFGTQMHLKEDSQIREIIENEWTSIFEEKRDSIREEAKKKIEVEQQRSKKNYDKGRKDARLYEEGDLVAIKRTQFGPGLKVCSKFLGPYKVIRKMRNDRYVVSKVGEHEGPKETSSSADNMKIWSLDGEDLLDE